METKDDFDEIFDLLCDVTDGRLTEADFRDKMKALNHTDEEVDEYLKPPV